ncbi:unnamed protein product [Penicillium glandicola]
MVEMAFDLEARHLGSHSIRSKIPSGPRNPQMLHFSTLGIVLLAALARLSKLTGISQLKQPVTKSKMIVSKEDLGERISRIEPPLIPVKISQSDSKVSKVPKKPTEKLTDGVSKSTKKKKKNAIDDLFSGLF